MVQFGVPCRQGTFRPSQVPIFQQPSRFIKLGNKDEVPLPTSLDTVVGPDDLYFLNRDLPHLRQRDFKLDCFGWPNLLGRWSPAVRSTFPSSSLRVPVTVITLDGTTGGTAGPHRSNAHYLGSDTAGLYDELARRLPVQGVSVLQLAYRRPGPHRFDECVCDADRAVSRASEHSFVVIVGHSMGGAVALLAACKLRPIGRLLGVCILASQTHGVPSAADLAVLQGADILLVHGTADQALPFSCSEEIWQRLSLTETTVGARHFMKLESASHCFEEHREQLTELVYGWLLQAAHSFQGP